MGLCPIILSELSLDFQEILFEFVLKT